MNLACLILRHRPLLNSIIVREERFTALCDRCGAPIERDSSRPWVGAAALTSGSDQVA